MTLLSETWLTPLGLIVCALGTLVGSGGGILLVPILLLTYPELGADNITEVSLIMVAANAISGALTYARMKGRIHYPTGIRFAAATFPGAVLGVLVVRRVGITSFMGLFGLLLLGLSILVAWRIMRRAWVDPIAVPSPDWRGMGASGVVGFLSTLFGIGGGALHVPLMTAWLGYPVHVATATSQFVLAITTTVGVVTHLVTHGTPPHGEAALFLAAGAIPGAMLGANLSARVGSRVIMLILASFLAVLAVRLIVRALGA